MKLTHKQALFVEEYLKDLNCEQAALRAGYSATTARRGVMLSDPRVQAALAERMQARTKRTQIDADAVLLRLVALADARFLTLAAMRQADYVPPPGALALSLTFCPPDKRRRDLDNLLAAMKPDFDGVSQALGVDDQLFEPLTLRRGEPVKGGRVVLEVGQ